ncbi:MAG: bifunctional indole-3-glycerol-phosphate synthase TrpC/phosphoribosylanthranilate isomerase TrpF, partial [Caulobacteraceae bacterium]
FIMEVKRASPSQGAMRPDLNPVDAARAYDGAASTISVLTDHAYFGGSMNDLLGVRAVTDLPVLCKDFVLSPYQVTEARAHGADAVLVMLSVLEDSEALACMAEARRLGMDALVEVHTAEEVDRALRLPAPIIGINNRDLTTLSVDLAVTERLSARVPADRLVVSESGITTRADVARLSGVADAFLVGSSLMKQSDLHGAARDLVFGRVKVCGLTRREDAEVARGAGAAFGGLIFASDSPRCVTLDTATQITENMHLPFVGVFRDERPDTVANTASALRLAAVQLHGAEDAAYVAALRPRLPEDCEVWLARGVDGSVPKEATPAHRTVFDTAIGGASGGTGQTFDWSLVKDRPDFPTGILAGGIGPANAVAARETGAWAIDASSRLESSTGVKDHNKINALFAALRGPGRRQRETA